MSVPHQQDDEEIAPTHLDRVRYVLLLGDIELPKFFVLHFR